MVEASSSDRPHSGTDSPCRPDAWARRAALDALGWMTLGILILAARWSGKRIYVIASKYGNLGNQLTLFSHLMASAIENNGWVLNPAFADHAEAFPAIKRDLFIRYPMGRSVVRGKKASWEWVYRLLHRLSFQVERNSGIATARTLVLGHNEVLNLDGESFRRGVEGKRVVFFRGWMFRDETSLRKHADPVRAFFTPAGRYEKAISEPIDELRRSCDLLFGIVVRHGDYRAFEGGRYFYELDRYVEIMRDLAAQHPEKRVGFFVCSDEEQDVRRFDGLRTVFRAKHDIENRFSLARCDYIVTPPSTYGLWAAFYGRKPLCWLTPAVRRVSMNDFVEARLF